MNIQVKEIYLKTFLCSSENTKLCFSFRKKTSITVGLSELTYIIFRIFLYKKKIASEGKKMSRKDLEEIESKYISNYTS